MDRWALAITDHRGTHGVDSAPSETIIRGLGTVAEATGSADLTDFVHIYHTQILGQQQIVPIFAKKNTFRDLLDFRPSDSVLNGSVPQ